MLGLVQGHAGVVSGAGGEKPRLDLARLRVMATGGLEPARSSASPVRAAPKPGENASASR